MPFPNVTLHGVERNFEQVLNSIAARVRPLIKIEDLVPDKDGWTLDDDFAAMETMIAASADKLWAAVIDPSGDSIVAALEARIAALELDQGRLTEQLASLQVGGEDLTAQDPSP